ncbi:PLD nuclease N-terminal domain-containing protein [Nesterenkonia natronophila]|uniref:PLDc_N domain-containing protein n=1 Tax=Nesterenkonia natronophila TaxID=2174932 RepID=A0A3A4F2M4_9MICC|nr:PLD nuclease N-terminal domain-containing protein [Nesterenkonia natronophila]RJN32303.1 PLDc_N domain-containing protein [Nesterenkonia natronophila]
MPTEILIALAQDATAGSEAVPWWLRFGVLVYGALLVAAFMIYAQTKHQRPWNVLWVLIIAFVPILGALCYFIAQTVISRRKSGRLVKGRAETMAPEEYGPEAAGDSPKT